MSTSPSGLQWSLRATALLATVTTGVAAVFYVLPADRTTPERSGGQAGTGTPLTARVHRIGHALGEAGRSSLAGSDRAPGRIVLPQLRHLVGALHATAR
ncbi:hypothetical protein [Saccharothrix sp. ST-888]|uniref:hypothetical protein n=1 Tax=Saccharothrix sp. ST-888 TaxID=1427391 RepID=UPI0006966172|nr:hypothetical protein [Saccharothrix sp. ST-888]